MDGNFSLNTPAQELDYCNVPPLGFFAKPDGIYIETETKDGEINEEWLCSPLTVVALGRNHKSAGWCRQIELTDPDGHTHQWIILDHMLSSSFTKVLAELRGLGLRVATGNSVKRHLSDLIQRWAPQSRYITTDRLGWSDDNCSAFVLGDKRIIGKGNVIFLNDTKPEGAPEMKPRGSLNEWRNTVSAPCEGNPILVTSVSLAFAGPLLEFLGLDGGGLHLRGGSSSGKSTALGIAVSVWGSPKFMHNWRATANALEGVAATCNGSVLALDELSQITGKDAGDAVYTLANGQGKSRSTSSGKLQPKARWRVMLLSTGEISLAEKMSEVGAMPMEGQEVRLVDIAADNRRFGVFDELHEFSDGATFSNRLKQTTSDTYGTAGPAFVKALLDSAKITPDFLNSLVKNIASVLKSPNLFASDGKVERVLNRFALIAAAGELASSFGITGWPKTTATIAAKILFTEWVEALEVAENSEIQAAIERTRAFLNKHKVTRFEETGGTSIDNKAGYRDADWFYILGDTWKEIHSGHSPKTQASHLLKNGWLVRGDGNNLMSKTSSSIPGRPRSYKVRATILDVDVAAAA